jgi:hypothetical protein
MPVQAKFLAFHDEPFRSEAWFPKIPRSFADPTSEIHAATTGSGQAAPFGFIGVGPDFRASVDEEILTAACDA